MKYWINTERKHLLVIDEDCIYVRKKFKSFIYGVISSKEELGLESSLHIPIHYLDRVNFVDKRNEIKFYYSNGSSESVFVAGESDKKEIYTLLKTQFPKGQYYSFTPTIYQVGRPQIISAIVTLIVFIASIALSRIEFEQGVRTGKYLAILLLVKGISNFGLVRMTIAYFIVTGLILIKLRKSISEIEKIDVIQLTAAKTDLDPNDVEFIAFIG